MTALPGRGWTAMASVGPAIKNCQEQLRKGSQCLRHCMIQIRWLTWLSLLQWYMVYVKIELRQDRQESRKRIEKGEDFIDCLMRSRSFVSVFFHRPEAWSICVNSPRPWFSPGWERTPMEWPLEALKNGSLKFEMIHKWFMIEERRQNSQTVQDFKIGDWDGEDSAQLWGEFRLRAKKKMRETWMHGRSFAESCFSWESTHGETTINISFLDQASACPRVRVENNQRKHRLHQNS